VKKARTRGIITSFCTTLLILVVGDVLCDHLRLDAPVSFFVKCSGIVVADFLSGYLWTLLCHFKRHKRDLEDMACETLRKALEG
jgi:hypothetical protein